VGAAAITLGLFAYAALTLGFLLKHQRSSWSKLLLAIAAVSILMSMPLALVWAWAQWTGNPLISMSWMLRVHGMANAHGFVLSGLLAWWVEERRVAGASVKVAAGA
jgi:hypothetical protein